MILSDDIGKNPMQSSSSSSSTLCVSCSRYQRSVVLIPCGHLILCVACAHSLASCPMCQSDISATLKIYE